MPQVVLSVVMEVQPESEAQLRGRIEAFRATQEAVPVGMSEPYDQLKAVVPSLHFMSITVFTDDQYDPVLIIEANFDGKPGPFWAQLEAAIGDSLRGFLRCCKSPRDNTAALFESVTRPGSRTPVAPLLEARTVPPLVYHQGNRGLERARILADGDLFVAAESAIDTTPAMRTRNPSEVHSSLRSMLLPKFPWLAEREGRRIGVADDIADKMGFGLYVLTLLFWLAAPGLALAIAVHWRYPNMMSAWALLILGAVASVLASTVGMLWMVRRLETADPPHDAPLVDPTEMRAMARREDRITQNHMMSIVHIKPGILRSFVLPRALRMLGFYLRAHARNGYLIRMRTIHFAHWALVSNRGRLMFLSNFDGSWESYLDDFIEKAHAGLTLAWTSGIGFPPTRYMIGGGASNGRKFKAWGRHSMRESLFWFSAYRRFSVNQIERQSRIATGLRKAQLTEQEAAAWALDL